MTTMASSAAPLLAKQQENMSSTPNQNHQKKFQRPKKQSKRRNKLKVVTLKNKSKGKGEGLVGSEIQQDIHSGRQTKALGLVFETFFL